MHQLISIRPLLPMLACALILQACESEAPVEEAAAELEPVAEEPAEEPAPPPKPTRRFVSVTGEVTLDGEAAAVDAEIPAEAKIVTAKGASAIITLEPGGIVEVREGSTVDIGTSDKSQISVKLVLGALWSFLPDNSSYEVVTSNATAGVRGTVFYTESRSKKESYICACDGSVQIDANNPKSFSKMIESKMEHKAVTIKTKGKRQKVKKAKRTNHTDDEKMALMPAMESAAAPAEEAAEPEGEEAPAPEAPEAEEPEGEAAPE